MSENMEKDYKQIERQTAADYEYSTPVSYTHLDVYKRQVISLSISRMASWQSQDIPGRNTMR